MESCPNNFAGWEFVGISIIGYLTVIALARHKLVLNEGEQIDNRHFAANIIFVSVKNIVFSNVSSKVEIVETRQSKNQHGQDVYIFEFVNKAAMTIVAEHVSEFLF